MQSRLVLNSSKIRELMKLEEISQKELAERIGVSPSTLSEWLTGKSFPTPMHLGKLAEALDADQDILHAEMPIVTTNAAQRTFHVYYVFHVHDGGVVNNYIDGGPRTDGPSQAE